MTSHNSNNNNNNQQQAVVPPVDLSSLPVALQRKLEKLLRTAEAALDHLANAHRLEAGEVALVALFKGLEVALRLHLQLQALIFAQFETPPRFLRPQRSFFPGDLQPGSRFFAVDQAEVESSAAAAAAAAEEEEEEESAQVVSPLSAEAGTAAVLNHFGQTPVLHCPTTVAARLQLVGLLRGLHRRRRPCPEAGCQGKGRCTTPSRRRAASITAAADFLGALQQMSMAVNEERMKRVAQAL